MAWSIGGIRTHGFLYTSRKESELSDNQGICVGLSWVLCIHVMVVQLGVLLDLQMAGVGAFS